MLEARGPRGRLHRAEAEREEHGGDDEVDDHRDPREQREAHEAELGGVLSLSPPLLFPLTPSIPPLPFSMPRDCKSCFIRSRVRQVEKQGGGRTDPKTKHHSFPPNWKS